MVIQMLHLQPHSYYPVYLTNRTGMITTKTQLDYEAGPVSHLLSVTVSDGVYPPITETVQITVRDVYEKFTVLNLPNTTTIDVKMLDVCDSPIVCHSRSS